MIFSGLFILRQNLMYGGASCGCSGVSWGNKIEHPVPLKIN